jgi:deazaflavin-dependent oxidoreductase (nitroreductase family)
MSYRYDDAGALRRLIRTLAGTQVGAWMFARTLDPADRIVFRLSRGRTTAAALLSGLPVIMLTTTGARTGRPRTLPVLGLPDGEELIVIGSNWGRRGHPAWYHNLRAHPHATVTRDGVSTEVAAELIEGPERERCFALAARIYPGYAAYRRRASHRHIGVFRLRPTSS